METTSPEVELMDKGLRKAAKNGDVEFLRKCVDDNKPNHFYLTVSPLGNMLHLAARGQQEEWIKEATKSLPVELIQQLLCQLNPHVFIEQNPLHLSARVGNVRIVKLFLKVFDMKQEEKKKDDASSSLPPPAHYVPNPPPWLMTDAFGNTPCHFALEYENQECCLEIWRMDKESLSNMVDDSGWSMLAKALDRGCDKVAMEILSSPHSFSTSADDFGSNALHLVPRCSSSSERRKDICRLLLEKMSELIVQKTNDGKLVFHTWAEEGYIWPFECLLESNDIIPNVRKDFVKLISTTNGNDENTLHYLAKYSSRSKERAQIGKLLIDIYREEANSHTLLNFPTGEPQYPWLAQAHDNKKTPLDYAMDAGNEEFTQMILSEDKNVLKTCVKNVLFVAIEKRFHEVPLKILEIVDEEEDLTHLLTNDQNLNALHFAPQCGSK